MIAYFKYTNGESYTLSGADYTGYFNIQDNGAYTGKVKLSTSKQLSAKGNFYSKCYENKLNFDRTDQYTLSTNFENIFALDILDVTSLSRVFDTLDRNNMQLFAAIANRNADLFNIQSKTKDNQAHFYCLSSTKSNSPQREDNITGKRVYTSADPFSMSQDWQYLDNCEGGAFILDSSNNFTYFVGTSSGAYAVDGNFSSQTPLTANEAIIKRLGITQDSPYNFVNDEILKQFYVISQESISVYDISSWDDCGSTILIDRLATQYQDKTFVSPFKFAVGNNYRVSLYYSNQDEILIHNKFTNELFYTITSSDIGFDSITAFDIRDEDDSVIVLGKKDSVYQIKLLDIQNAVTVVSSHTFVESIPNYHYPAIQRDYKIRFAPFDSNAILIYNGADVQIRYISSPEQIVIGLTRSGMLYLDDYLWDLTEERFNKIKIKFDCNKSLANYPNILNCSLYGLESGIKMIVHCIGRIYCLDLTNIFEVSDLDIPVTYNGVESNTKSSLSLTLNSLLQSIINDTINIYNSCGAIAMLNPQDSLDLKQTYIGLTEIQAPKIEDLYLHENEDVNTATLQRVILGIYNLQQSLATGLSG